MQNRINDYELRKADLTPLVGFTSYLTEIVRDNDLPEMSENRGRIAINTLALATYNILIGVGCDRLIDYFSN